MSHLFQVLDLDRLDLVRGLEAEDLREEREVRRERAPRVLAPCRKPWPSPSNAMYAYGMPRRCERVDDLLGLRRRHDLVVEPLQNSSGARDRVGMRDRRALAVEVDRLRPRTDEVLVVVGLELVRVLVERHQIGDAEVATRRRRTRRRTASASSVVYPPALPPVISTAVGVDVARAPRGSDPAAALSSTSTTPHCPRSRSRYSRP